MGVVASGLPWRRGWGRERLDGRGGDGRGRRLLEERRERGGGGGGRGEGGRERVGGGEVRGEKGCEKER